MTSGNRTNFEDEVDELAALCRKPLRDFSEVTLVEAESHGSRGEVVVLAVDGDRVPMPKIIHTMFSFALPSICFGRGEKSAWERFFKFKGRTCSLSLGKFGLRLTIAIDASYAIPRQCESDLPPVSVGRSVQVSGEVRVLADEIIRKINAACSIWERKALKEVAKESLAAGNVTILNQHRTMRRMYEHFRGRAERSWALYDEVVAEVGAPGMGLQDLSAPERVGFHYGHMINKVFMERDQAEIAFYDTIAMINAYFSYLEHLLVLSIPSTDIDPSNEPVDAFIRSRMFDKFERVFKPSCNAEPRNFKHRLHAVAERWRNPYSHGGFDKHHATIYFHTPQGGIPIGLSDYRSHPSITFAPEREATFDDARTLFDELDGWLRSSPIGPSLAWAHEGLHVSLDGKSLAEFRAAVLSGHEAFHSYLGTCSVMRDRAENMDW